MLTILADTDINDNGHSIGPIVGCLICHTDEVRTLFGINIAKYQYTLNCPECLETLVEAIWADIFLMDALRKCSMTMPTPANKKKSIAADAAQENRSSVSRTVTAGFASTAATHKAKRLTIYF
jgi:hypothetical protein